MPDQRDEIALSRRGRAIEALEADDEENRGDEIEDLRQPVWH